MIICSAIKLENGTVVIGFRHHHCIQNYVAATGEQGIPIPHTQGFMTDEGEFLTRESALIYAKAQNQIVRISGNQSSKELFSEDLWVGAEQEKKPRRLKKETN